uniref:DvnT2 protein n=3 Tax=Carnobacterium divergens TaxID=2748 RepID=Q9ZEG5_CARDV|nr:dvnT2 [Carnobacterium divergens]
MKINQKYYNNKEQIQAAIPIVRNILDKLNGDNQEELKGMLINFQNELWSPKLDALLLNRMCLDISNCLVSNGIILSKEESNSFKDLFKLIQTSEK